MGGPVVSPTPHARSSVTTRPSTSSAASGHSRLRPLQLPTAFVQLASLVYSDEKPPTWQLIAELFHILLELSPTPAPLVPPTPAFYRMGHSGAASTSTLVMSPVPESALTLPHPHTTAFSLLRAILFTPKPAPTESFSAPVDPHAFIQSLHTCRNWATYAGTTFWVSCHPNNTIWKLVNVDINFVEAQVG